MKLEPLAVDWYFDILSPFAYLQLQGLDDPPAHVTLTPKPVLLGAILKHWGQIGPAEIEPKRLQTYRLCQFRAATRGIPFRFPPRHPFNPLKAARLLTALGPNWAQVRAAFRFVFEEGRAADTPDELEALGRALGVEGGAGELSSSQEAKDRLRGFTEEAIALGVFGVPTFAAKGELFWGDDSTAMFLAWLDDPAMFQRGEMARLKDIPVGVTRNR